MKRLLLLPILCLMPAAQSMDYVKCEAMQKAAARLELSMNTQASEARKAIVGPAFQKVQEECMAEFNGMEVFKCMGPKIAPYEAEGDAARDAVVAKYSPRISRVLADYEAEGCY